MKKILLFVFFCAVVLVPSLFSQPFDQTNPPLNVEENDGSPSTYPYKLKVPNNSLTDNGDETSSLSFSDALNSTYLLLNQSFPQTTVGNFTFPQVNVTGTFTAGAGGFNVNGTGSVGIGTNDPLQKLSVVGNSSFTGDMYVSDDVKLGISGGGYIQFDDQATDEINIIGANVGIGTSAPKSPLQVEGVNRADDDYGNLNVFTTDAASASKGGTIVLGGKNGQAVSPYGFAKIRGGYAGSSWSGYLAFGVTNSSSQIPEWMRLTSSGYLGIGTTAPAYKLDVAGQINASGVAVGNTSNTTPSTIRLDGDDHFYGRNAAGNWVQLDNNATGAGTYVNFTTNETADINWNHSFNTSENVSAAYLIGDGSLLTNVVGGNATPVGSNFSVQFNNGGVFGGDENFTYTPNDSANDTVRIIASTGEHALNVTNTNGAGEAAILADSSAGVGAGIYAYSSSVEGVYGQTTGNGAAAISGWSNGTGSIGVSGVVEGGGADSYGIFGYSDEGWAGYFDGKVKATDYYSGDGTQGYTGSCADGTALTVKDGLITGCS